MLCEVFMFNCLVIISTRSWGWFW